MHIETSKRRAKRHKKREIDDDESVDLDDDNDDACVGSAPRRGNYFCSNLCVSTLSSYTLLPSLLHSY